MHLPFADASADDEEPGACLGVRGLRDPGEERGRLEEILELARRASTGESKLALLRRFMRRISEPAIIFTEYRDTLQRVAAALAGIDAVQLHGGLAPRDRIEALSRFAAGDARLLLATDAASEGLNLHHRCRLVVNLELPWTPVRLDQRAGRVDRIGQSRSVHAIRLVAAGTSEESVLARLAGRIDRVQAALGVPPDEQIVAESVLGGAPMPPILPPALSHSVVHADLRGHAADEAERLAQAKGWLAAAGNDYPESRPVIVRLRQRSSRRTCLWTYRLSIVSASERVVWETILAAAASLAATPGRSARATRASLQESAVLRRVIGDTQASQVDRLREALRRPLGLWVRRELDLMSVIRNAHARMSADLLQGTLFDRRNQRAATSQASTLADALAQCGVRLEELRACDEVRPERCELAFAVMLE
jgi:superfamily II DNA/RNA helicase